MYHKKDQHGCTWKENDEQVEVQATRNTDHEIQSINIVCKFCEKVFQTKCDLMKHKKDDHREEVEVCWKLAAGKCPFGTQKCWFIHDEVTEFKEYTCKLCDNTFSNLPELMKHKKEYHIQTVQACKNRICIYGRQKCWYKHEISEKEIIEPIENNEDGINENNDVIQRLMKMVETLTQRIFKIEETNS